MNNIYMALGHDIHEDFYFIKVGSSIDVERRIKELRMKLLCYWETSHEWGCGQGRPELEKIFLGLPLQRTQFSKGAEFAGYTECIGNFKARADAMIAADALIMFGNSRM